VRSGQDARPGTSYLALAPSALYETIDFLVGAFCRPDQVSEAQAEAVNRGHAEAGRSPERSRKAERANESARCESKRKEASFYRRVRKDLS